ncbi:NAD(P)-dependent alcohol dehydrogenase [Leifsonia sp. NPDC058248]|uniref:NAD(P)-dependent alcohol dehydrogenase n=1 Tax=Leifsonia sp. NPDC058248 TaxID=3346402 RepID=UPI0036D9D35A
MRAAVYRRFGGPEVVHVEELPKPTPGPDDVLIRVHASTVSVADYRARSRDLPKGLWFFGPLTFGAFRPRIPVLGMDAAGVVEAVGANVTRFSPGDEVIAMLGSKFGGHAEYARIPEHGGIALKPANLDFDDAASLIFGGHTAVSFLDRAGVGAGDEVLVNGASGAVGSAAVQIAKHRGATVTAVCSGANAELVRELGADRVIDYAETDFASEGLTYDAIVECVGNAPFERVESSIKPGGAYLPVISDLRGMLRARGNARRSGKAIPSSSVPSSPTLLAEVVAIAEQGGLRPVIDSAYGLDDVAEAHRRVATGHKRGNVVLRIRGAEEGAAEHHAAAEQG